ncbi:MBL fold metallo-hydrolase [Jannaschia sp. LMIT008]|uniref:MBL fold metallo-hydrolase n=1 Tax=Jannaschia maritima TaxID=3032585 RepID=UPI002810B24A|nr:MBL fold metallo-hydrolase [Jannaschia sp. LMIT008]
MSLRVEIHGARGSRTADGPDTLRYGGATSCVSVRWEDPTRAAVFDCGSGAAHLGRRLRGEGVTDVTLLLGHLHLDHVQGLPFFAGGLGRGTRLHVACPCYPDLRDVIARLYSPPFYPLFPEDWGPDLTWDVVPDRIGGPRGPTLRHAALNHPGSCTGYRIDHDGAGFAYLTDHQPGDAEHDANLRDLARGAALALIDSTFTPEEVPHRKGWGHGDWARAVALGDGAHTVGLFHHEPGRTDEALDAIQAQASAARPGTFAARAGQVLELADGALLSAT